jgi:ribosomal protein L37E
MRVNTPCRECGKTHHNLQSTSICASCGAASAERKATEAYDRETTASENKHQSFEDIETVHEMKEWIRDYLL